MPAEQRGRTEAQCNRLGTFQEDHPPLLRSLEERVELRSANISAALWATAEWDLSRSCSKERQLLLLHSFRCFDTAHASSVSEAQPGGAAARPGTEKSSEP
jgi:hypothetical protein